MTASEEEWMSQRTNMCERGRLIHFILLGWAGFFLTELVIRYIGHQGASNFFLAKSKCRCRANLSQNHFRAILTFDWLTEGMQLLFDIVIGSNWYANTVEGVETMGTVGMTYFILFFYITNYQFLRLFVCIIAANYELNEDEKLQAQEIILMYEFEQAKDRPTSDYYKEYSTEKLDQNFNPVGAYDEFSFNKHYMNA